MKTEEALMQASCGVQRFEDTCLSNLISSKITEMLVRG